ncbi:hypothetical protein Rsub_08044 [Raphidocelis subcapitata]|uniref:Heterogeneous nuclear ribonucleoprotein Q acidic domain-containing protein n=1 Tax=Raphidocelis subcapitata TaxID=307507 RepID=A0A2V0P7T3_9CHLO|nr:hypothetical protein Rsub_08044 [Raphidocelis subcapitata]|eukprot:GBF95921.1 hypothetical protein Rsub_08044 [Raphidocelis subcapitata]
MHPFGGGSPYPWPPPPHDAGPFMRPAIAPRGPPSSVPVWFSEARLLPGVHMMLDAAYSRGFLQHDTLDPACVSPLSELSEADGVFAIEEFLRRKPPRRETASPSSVFRGIVRRLQSYFVPESGIPRGWQPGALIGAFILLGGGPANRSPPPRRDSPRGHGRYGGWEGTSSPRRGENSPVPPPRVALRRALGIDASPPQRSPGSQPRRRDRASLRQPPPASPLGASPRALRGHRRSEVRRDAPQERPHSPPRGARSAEQAGSTAAPPPQPQLQPFVTERRAPSPVSDGGPGAPPPLPLAGEVPQQPRAAQGQAAEMRHEPEPFAQELPHEEQQGREHDQLQPAEQVPADLQQEVKQDACLDQQQGPHAAQAGQRHEQQQDEPQHQKQPQQQQQAQQEQQAQQPQQQQDDGGTGYASNYFAYFAYNPGGDKKPQSKGGGDCFSGIPITDLDDGGPPLRRDSPAAAVAAAPVAAARACTTAFVGGGGSSGGGGGGRDGSAGFGDSPAMDPRRRNSGAGEGALCFPPPPDSGQRSAPLSRFHGEAVKMFGGDSPAGSDGGAASQSAAPRAAQGGGNAGDGTPGAATRAHAAARLRRRSGPSRAASDAAGGSEDGGGGGLRAAVTELVKELLWPAWQAGQLTREAFKQIARRATEKVLSSLPPLGAPDVPPDARPGADEWLAAKGWRKSVRELVDRLAEAAAFGDGEAGPRDSGGAGGTA